MKRPLTPLITLVLIIRFAAAILAPPTQGKTPLLINPPGAVVLAVPSGLTCDLLRWPEKALITYPSPRFGWQITPESGMQTAYHLVVGRDEAGVRSGAGSLWDSGRVQSDGSQNVAYGGPALEAMHSYWWAVRFWNEKNQASGWSLPQRFNMGHIGDPQPLSRFNPTIEFNGQPMWENRQLVEQHEVAPVKVEVLDAIVRVDFGRDAFGTLQLSVPAGAIGAPVSLSIRLGEKLAPDGTIDRKPGGSINYREFTMNLTPGQQVYRLIISSRPSHLRSSALQMPAAGGEVTPFRYAEIEGPIAVLRDVKPLQLAVWTPFDDDASSFTSSDKNLNAVWDLCKYTMKGTSFMGVYIDGERERLPYEADAYINQMGHYASDNEYAMARYAMAYLLAHPTWPTEWSFHAVMMAHADYIETGNADFIMAHYDELKKKLLVERARPEDGLLRSSGIVDWPPGERDGFGDGLKAPGRSQQVGPEVNSVVNAFYFHCLGLMAEMAEATGHGDDALEFRQKAGVVYASFNHLFYDSTTGLYIDGEGSRHSSLHANLFPLAFGLVPPERRSVVARWLVSRGMRCSVYGAQYLLEGLFRSDQDEAAIRLLTSTTDRSWMNMLAAGSTMTTEAWDIKYKGNLTWNHAWGAAPANLISRYVLGVQPLDPGFTTMSIRPHPGSLQSVSGRVPTPRGPVSVAYQQGKSFHMEIEVPGNTHAIVALPAAPETSVVADGMPTGAERDGHYLVIGRVGPGRHVFEVQ